MIVIDPDPVRVLQTRGLVEYLDERAMPHCFFINKLDKPGSDFRATLAALIDTYGKRVVAEHLPIGDAERFRGYIDLAERHAYVAERGVAREIPIENELAGTVEEARQRLLETLGDFDDHLLEELIEGIEPPLDEVRGDLREETCGDLIVPVLAGSGLVDITIAATALLDVIEKTISRTRRRPERPARGPSLQDDRPPSIRQTLGRARLQRYARRGTRI